MTANRPPDAGIDVAAPVDAVPQADTTDPVNAPDPEGDPTGMLAGETTVDRQREAAGRAALEQALPGRPGSWKASGAVPDAEPGRPRG